MALLSAAPLIGVTAPDHGHRTEWRLTRLILTRLGAEVARLAPSEPGPVDTLDGLVLAGGEDLQEPPSARDRFELDMLARAERRGLPVLGLCRGSQLMAVAAGGALHADVTHLRPPGWPRRLLRPRLHVLVHPDSRLAGILGTDRLRTNALHHQAVRDPGRGRRVVARDEYGLVQATEADDHPFRIGVQWHPELLPGRRLHRRLFAALVAAAASPATRTQELHP